MRKFIDLCKKPFLIASAVLTVVAMVALIVVCCLPHGNTYTYSTTAEGLYSIKVTAELGNNGKGKMTMVMSLGSQSQVETNEFEYAITNGEIFIKSEESGEFERMGKISSFDIVADTGDLGMTMTMKCGTNIALRTAAITLMVIGAVLTAACVTILVLDKKGKLGSKKKTTAPETTIAA